MTAGGPPPPREVRQQLHDNGFDVLCVGHAPLRAAPPRPLRYPSPCLL